MHRRTPASSTTGTTSTPRCAWSAPVSRPRLRVSARLTRSSASFGSRTPARRAPTRSTCASGRSRGATSTSRPGRIPSTFGAFSRRTYSTRQSAHRLPARLSVPDVAAARRAARERRRPAPHARTRLAVELPDRQPDASGRHAARRSRSAGTPASRCTRRSAGSKRAASVTTGSLSNPLFSDDNGGRQIAGRVARRRRCRGSSLARRPSRALVRDVGRGAAGARDAATSRRRSSAPTSSTRATTTWSAFEAAGQHVRPARRSSRDCARVATDARGTLQAHAASVRRRRASITSASARSSGPRARRRGTPRSRGWEAGGGYSLQRNIQVQVSVQHNTRDGGRVRHMTALAAPDACTGSDMRRHRSHPAARSSSRSAASATAARRSRQPERRATASITRPRRPAAPSGRRPGGGPGVADLGTPATQPRRRAPDVGRLPRDGAARRVRAERTGARGDGPAQRDVRAARARHHDRHDGRLPEQRPDLPQRLLALEDATVRPRAATPPAGPSRSASIARASSASSATSTRT